MLGGYPLWAALNGNQKGSKKNVPDKPVACFRFYHSSSGGKLTTHSNRFRDPNPRPVFPFELEALGAKSESTQATVTTQWCTCRAKVEIGGRQNYLWGVIPKIELAFPKWLVSC